MNARHPNSQLQVRILVCLKYKEVKSVAELARQIEASRPSVSRALSTLEKDGLVTKVERHWILTDAGQEIVGLLEQQVPIDMGKALKDATKFVDQYQQLIALTKPVTFGVADTIAPSVSKLAMPTALGETITALNKLTAFDSINNLNAAIQPNAALQSMVRLLTQPSLDAVSKSIDVILKNRKQADQFVKAIQPSLGAAYASQNALTSFVQSQRLGLDTLEKQIASFASPRLLPQLSATNLGLSHIIADLGKISVLSPYVSAINTGLLAHLTDVGQTYNQYFQEVVTPVFSPTEPEQYLDIVVPTQATVTFVGTVKDVVEAEALKEPLASSARWQDQAAQFDEVLRSIGPKYLRKWHGAWETLHSTNPDRFSQAAHSGRELLMQILADLAPDSAFSPDEINQYGHKGGVTRKMRIRRILNNRSASAVDWAESLAKGCDAVYDHLVGISHDRSPEPTTTEREVVGLLMALGGLLLSIVG